MVFFVGMDLFSFLLFVSSGYGSVRLVVGCMYFWSSNLRPRRKPATYTQLYYSHSPISLLRRETFCKHITRIPCISGTSGKQQSIKKGFQMKSEVQNLKKKFQKIIIFALQNFKLVSQTIKKILRLIISAWYCRDLDVSNQPKVPIFGQCLL